MREKFQQFNHENWLGYYLWLCSWLKLEKNRQSSVILGIFGMFFSESNVNQLWSRYATSPPFDDSESSPSPACLESSPSSTALDLSESSRFRVRVQGAEIWFRNLCPTVIHYNKYCHHALLCMFCMLKSCRQVSLQILTSLSMFILQLRDSGLALPSPVRVP